MSTEPTTPISPKVTAGAAVAAATTIVIFVLAQLGLDVPVLVQGAITTILAFVAGYLKTDPLRGTGVHRSEV